jgi:hypothetical protein
VLHQELRSESFGAGAGARQGLVSSGTSTPAR